MSRHGRFTPAKRVYIGNAVFMSVFAWLAFRPFYVGYRLFGGLSGEGASSGEVFIGVLIWLCAILMLLLSECAVYYTFRFCKPKKRRFASWGAAAFFTVTLIRILYTILQNHTA